MASVSAKMTERGASQNMLLVEDELHCRVAMQRLLRSHGFHVKAVGSAEEALEVLKSPVEKEGLSFMVVDVDLPGISGLDFLSRVLSSHPDVHAFLVTGADRHMVESFATEHDVCYLPKPLDVPRFFSVIGEITRQQPLPH